MNPTIGSRRWHQPPTIQWIYFREIFTGNWPVFTANMEPLLSSNSWKLFNMIKYIDLNLVIYLSSHLLFIYLKKMKHMQVICICIHIYICIMYVWVSADVGGI